MTARLEYGSAICLIAALVDDRARRAGLRVLFVKGPFFAALGVRPPKTSLDLDVILHPDDMGSFVRLLTGEGWRLRDDLRAVLPFEEHSVTLLHGFWPSSVDAHRYWPGLLGDPRAAFERLWERHEEVTLSTGRFAVPQWTDAAVLQAVNEIRGGLSRASGVRDVAQLAREKLGPGAGPIMARQCRELRAELSAGPMLELLGETVTIPSPPPPGYREWLRRIDAEDRSATAWILRMRDEPPWRWPAHLLAALALRPSQLRALRPEARPGVRGFLDAWWARATKGGHDLAHARKALRRSVPSQRGRGARCGEDGGGDD